MFDNFSKVYVSVEDLAVRIMHVDPDRLLFMFCERILIFLKSDSFYLPSVKTPKMAANPLKKTEIRRYTTEVPAFRPFFQRYGWTLCSGLWSLLHGVISLPGTMSCDKWCYITVRCDVMIKVYFSEFSDIIINLISTLLHLLFFQNS